MNVQDAISGFDFLSKFNWIAFIFLTASILILASFFVGNIIDKMYHDRKQKNTIITFTIIFVVLCMCVLKYQANRNYDYSCKANNIKAYLLKTDNYNCGYIELANRANFDDNEKVADRIEEIKDITRSFPDVFAEATMTDPDIANDSIGIQLVDRTLYNERAQKLLPLFKATILYYMRASSSDTLSYERIQQTIDERCDNDVLDMLIAKNPRLFTFIFAPYDIYYKGVDTVKTIGGDQALRISIDSAKTYLGRNCR